MKLRKTLNSPQRSIRRLQCIPIMLKTEQVRLGLRDIVGSNMASQPHELGIVMRCEQRTLLSRLREPREHPVPRQRVASRMLVFENGVRHFHHHHIGEMAIAAVAAADKYLDL